MSEFMIEMIDIRKEFPGIVANDNVNLQLRKSEIHALLGENGAGKSTLMSVLFGLYPPDGGEIFVRGEKVNIHNPNVANKLGIGMVHQHFKLVHNFTVTENVILGIEPRKWCVDVKAASEKLEKLSHHYGLDVDPSAKIEDISVGMQQRVEILKMLYRENEILIFDEPTAVLMPQEIKELMQIMRNLINQGKSIIFITHKLKEIKEAADRCTVLRRGKVIGTVDVKDTSEAKMAEMMVGRKVSFAVEKQPKTPGDTVLRIENIFVKNKRNVMGLKNFSLDVRQGEIVGIAGVDGNGQTELVEALTGLAPVLSGKILLNGNDITKSSIKDRINKKMAHIPEDRHKRGLILDYNLMENAIMEIYDKEPFSKNGILNKNMIREYTEKILADFDVRAGEGAVSAARSLSGGNQQKAIVGREISRDPDLLIAVQPTRGLDVGAIEYIHKRLIEQRDNGKAILLISLELDEVLNISDRIAAINGGELIGIVNASETDEKEVGLMMAGVKNRPEMSDEKGDSGKDEG